MSISSLSAAASSRMSQDVPFSWNHSSGFRGGQGPTHCFRRVLELVEPPLSSVPRHPRLMPLLPRHAQPKPDPVLESLARYRKSWAPELGCHRTDRCILARITFTRLGATLRPDIPVHGKANIGIPRRSGPLRPYFALLATVATICLWVVSHRPSFFELQSSDPHLRHHRGQRLVARHNHRGLWETLSTRFSNPLATSKAASHACSAATDATSCSTRCARYST